VGGICSSVLAGSSWPYAVEMYRNVKHVDEMYGTIMSYLVSSNIIKAAVVVAVS
jgi:hypothetical protein